MSGTTPAELQSDAWSHGKTLCGCWRHWGLLRAVRRVAPRPTSSGASSEFNSYPYEYHRWTLLYASILRGGLGTEFVTRFVNVIERVRTVTVVYLSVLDSYSNTTSIVFIVQFVRPIMRLVINRKPGSSHNGSSIWSGSETCGHRCDNHGDRHPIVEKVNSCIRITVAQ